MFVDAKTNHGIETYKYVDEDIDTFLVQNIDGSAFEDGFTITKRYNFHFAETLNCKVINKSHVVSYYADYDNIHSYFGNMSVICEDENGRIKIMTHKKPQEYASEFTYEEYYCDRGENYPPIRLSRYYAIVEPDDTRLQRNVISHIHNEYPIKTYGIYPGISESEYTDKIVEYLVEKLGNERHDDYGPLFIGSYGYRIPHYKYSTDIDLVFERVIPRVYDLYKKEDRGIYSKANFFREIITSIINIDLHVGKYEKYYFIINGKTVDVTPEYKYYMRLQAHLKLMECYKAGIEPYTELELSKVMYWLVHRNSEYKNKHIPVFWENRLLCKDLGAYTKKTMRKLLFFNKFEK